MDEKKLDKYHLDLEENKYDLSLVKIKEKTPKVAIHICGRDDVPNHCGLPITDIVSIGGVEDCPNIAPFRGKNFTLHRFNFDDINEIRSDATAPSYEIINRMTYIFDDILRWNCDVLFHCMAGRNRSSAAAFIFLICAGWSYQDAANEVVRVRGVVAPNLLMIKFADEVLSKNGEMRKFVQDHFGNRFGNNVDYKNYKFE